MCDCLCDWHATDLTRPTCCSSSLWLPSSHILRAGSQRLVWKHVLPRGRPLSDSYRAPGSSAHQSHHCSRLEGRYDTCMGLASFQQEFEPRLATGKQSCVICIQAETQGVHDEGTTLRYTVFHLILSSACELTACNDGHPRWRGLGTEANFPAVRPPSEHGCEW